MYTFLLIVHCIVTIALVGVILLQKSDGTGIALGGQVGDVMTPRGTANLLTRMTAVLATIFMVNCLVLAYIAVRSRHHQSILSTSYAAPGDISPSSHASLL